MARRYHVEGTRRFLYWGVVFLVIGLWCVKDGWFPSADVLVRHPLGKVGDSFYLFNKSLAILSLLGAAVCGYIHKVVK